MTNQSITIHTLKVGEEYRIKEMPSVNFKLSRSYKAALEDMKHNYYRFTGITVYDKVCLFYADNKHMISISPEMWKDMTFVDKSMVQERAKEFYTIRKIYEQATDESGQLGTGPLDLIREMLGKV